MNPTLLQKKSPPKKSLQWKNLSYTRLKRRGLCSPQVIFQHLHGLDADPWPESKPVRFTPTPCLGTACSETRCKTAAPKGRPRFTSHRLFPLGRICILIPPPPSFLPLRCGCTRPLIVDGSWVRIPVGGCRALSSQETPPGTCSLSGLTCLEFLGLAAGFGFQMWKQFKFCFHNPQQFASKVHVLI